MSSYTELKDRHAKEFAEFPMFFAFSPKQFNEGMEKLGLKTDDVGKVYKGPAGMIYKRTDAKALKELMDSHRKEQELAIKSDLTGDGYILEMFRYELNNHEYGYTLDPTDALDALGITLDDLQKNKPLREGYNQAIVICQSESC